MNETLAGCGKTYGSFKLLLDSPSVLMFVVTQHQAFPHPKILSVPLGIRPSSAGTLTEALHYMAVLLREKRGSAPVRKRLVLNNSGWNYRQDVNEYINSTFGEDNTYRLGRNAVPKGKHLPGYHAERQYALELAGGKFVVCPPGLGFDTYRLWQALAMGAIPIVESSPGLDRTYSRLPVLVVKSLLAITPEFLDRVYPCFVQNADRWRYEHITQAYWDHLLARALATGSIAHVMEAHPQTNPHCWFLEN